MKPALAVLLGLLATQQAAHAAAVGPGPRFECVVSSSAGSAASADEFGEAGTVFVHLAFEGIRSGAHVIEGEWYGPEDKLWERTKVGFDVCKSDKGRKRVYLWLKFHPRKSWFRSVFPIVERQKCAVKIILDGKDLTRKTFHVWR